MVKLNIKNLLYFIFSFLCLVLLSNFIVFAAETPEDLKESINSKTENLQEINQKILQTQKELEETEQKGKTLQNEIKQTNYRLNQIDLSIKSSEINIDKLGLEIKSLGYDINDIRIRSNLKKAGIGQFLKEIQKKDNESLLVIFLKNKSLAENLSELEQLEEINSGLANEVDELQILTNELTSKLNLTSEKKSDVEQENKNLKNKKIIASNQKVEKNNLLAQTKNQEKLYQNLISSLEKEQKAIADQIEELEAELRLKIDPSLLPTPRPGVLEYPVAGARLTQGYGATAFAKYGYKGQWHNGLDFAAPLGTPMVAAEDGIVLAAWNQDEYCYRGAYGKFIAIEHNNNLTTLYTHLSLMVVNEGDQVKRGDVIGYVGNTGYSTGPHVHFGVYASATFRIAPSKLNCGPKMPYGGDLDPGDYL
ncbi:peptidoglycan DD-metalloendopeptidase family protein [Candidatus Wolfebacteria bacterium]|nr:peptidoglycan DD-metalloendopeptidase family protein [Candidatus Wolfebacteria bacterium]